MYGLKYICMCKYINTYPKSHGMLAKWRGWMYGTSGVNSLGSILLNPTLWSQLLLLSLCYCYIICCCNSIVALPSYVTLLLIQFVLKLNILFKSFLTTKSCQPWLKYVYICRRNIGKYSCSNDHGGTCLPDLAMVKKLYGTQNLSNF